MLHTRGSIKLSSFAFPAEWFQLSLYGHAGYVLLENRQISVHILHCSLKQNANFFSALHSQQDLEPLKGGRGFEITKNGQKFENY